MTATVTAPSRHTELGRFLRSCRERVTPESAGLPPGGRRRTPGLRREEVAALAGVGTTWYTWLEQGRDVNPSIQVLDSLAGTLQLDATERNFLFRLGGHTPPPRETDYCDAAPTVQPILDALTPNPAALMNARNDLLAYNRAFRFLITDLAEIPPDERNCIWLDFTNPAWINAYASVAGEQEAIVARCRAMYADTVDDPLWPAFIAKLSGRSPEFQRLWRTGNILNPADWEKEIINPTVGSLFLRVTSFTMRDRPRLRLVTYMPRDDATTDKLATLAQMTAARP